MFRSRVVLDRLAARAAAPVLETWVSRRQRLATRPQDHSTVQKPAPQATRFHDVNVPPVPFTLSTKPTQLKGILKKTHGHRSIVKRAVTWIEGDISGTEIVDRWIDVHPNPDRLLGALRGWATSADGETEITSGDDNTANHAECRRSHCNKRGLHQYARRKFLECHLQDPEFYAHLPPGEHMGTFNSKRGFTFGRRGPN
ncbi:MAG: hypothetical protein Q9181_001624 [Wetmoreana brouardii]